MARKSARDPSPDSLQKGHLRRKALEHLSELKDELGRDLNYFGLPSGRMYDVSLWKRVLNQVFAVERDPDTATEMYRTAGVLGIRDRFHAFEAELIEVTRLLALDDANLKATMAAASPVEQHEIALARATGFDVINIDLCGGFLYSTNSNTDAIDHVIKHQARLNTSFLFITTLEERDTGNSDYDRFIEDTLNELQSLGLDVSDVKQFYLDDSMSPIPIHLRRMRFCVPIFLLKQGNDHFRVTLESIWNYKNFFHVIMKFVARQQKSSLGTLWPPITEVTDILSVPLRRIDVDTEGTISITILDTPTIPEPEDAIKLSEESHE